MPEIKYSEFAKLDMRIGKVIEVIRVPDADKLYKMQIDIGEKKIQIVSSLVPYYTEEEILNRKIIVLINLKPTIFRGELSEGMLLCAETDDGKECVLLTPEKDIGVGAKVT